MKDRMRDYVIGKIPILAAHWEAIVARTNFLDCESTENLLTVDLTDEMKVVGWYQEDKKYYEFALQRDIDLLFEYIFECRIPYKLKIRITSEEWRQLFNGRVNEMLQRKKTEEIREIIKFVEINNS